MQSARGEKNGCIKREGSHVRERLDRQSHEQILQYMPNFHPYDAAKLAEDLQRSSPNLPPDDAVKYFFRPLRPQRGPVG